MVKREHTSDLEEAEEDLLSPPPSDASLPKKSKSADSSSIYESKPTPPSRSNMAKVKSESGSPGKRKGAWSKDELQHLYAIMCPKRVSRTGIVAGGFSADRTW